MDYTGVIKRAWRIVWRYKILWLFGLFVGGMGGGGGGGGGNTGYDFGSGDVPAGFERFAERMESFADWAASNVALLIAAGSVLVLIGIIWWILSIAASPGLVHLVSQAEEGRPVRGGDGWRVGFHYWLRHFGLGLVLFLPFIAAILLFAGLALILILPAASSQGAGGTGEAIGAAILGVCCLGGIFILVLIAAGILLSLLYTLGLRYIVIYDRPVFGAIGDAWNAVRSRFKDVFVMWLLVIVVGFAFTIAVAIIGGLLALPAVFMLLAGQVEAAVLVFLALILILLLPSAIYGAFISAIWTVFFRDLTGLTAIPAAEAQQPSGMPGAGYPAAPEPPAETYLPPPPSGPVEQPPAPEPPSASPPEPPREE